MPKLKDIIAARDKYADDIKISVGDQTLSLGDIRTEISENDNSSLMAELEERERNVLTAQSNLGDMLMKVSEASGVPIEDLVEGRFEKLTKKEAKEAVGGDPDDPKVKAMVDSLVKGSLAPLQKTLDDTRKALGVALKVNLDQYYEDTWDEKLAPKIPKGKDGKPLVKLDLASVMKHANENKMLDARGRLNVRRAFDELTYDVRHTQELAEAEERGAKRREEELRAAAIPKPGQQRQGLINPPTVTIEGKGGKFTRTKTIEEALTDALSDDDILRTMQGVAGVA